MTDLRQALAEIDAIRAQVARATRFRGYGPASTAASGVLALVVAAVQSHLSAAGREGRTFVAVWAATAAVAIGFSAWETFMRARRVHIGFARQMTHAAVEQFLPAVAVGTLLTVVFLGVAPQSLWMLPGLWAIIFSLGIFASCRFLPRTMFAVGLWYLASGLICLCVQSGQEPISAWSMGIPFGIGQLAVAAALKSGDRDADEENLTR